MGWWNTSIQVQAEELPLYRHGSSYSVSWYGRSDEIWLWQGRGFYAAESLPVTYCSDSCKVDFPVKRSLFFLKHGYALPCSLQWYWNEADGLVVSRSIISEGWWQAWKWWPDAKWWYLERRPELFADMDWWGKPDLVRYEPEDDPYAAVLGGQK